MIAHEMNNILTPLGSYAQLSMSHPDDIELAKKTIRKTALNSERAARILHSMLTMARRQKQDKKDHNVKSLIEEVFTLIARDFSKDRIKLKINIPDGLTVYAEAICLQQVMTNLILNARDAIVSSKTTSGALGVSAYSQDDLVILKVSDNGCGVETADMEKILGMQVNDGGWRIITNEQKIDLHINPHLLLQAGRRTNLLLKQALGHQQIYQEQDNN